MAKTQKKLSPWILFCLDLKKKHTGKKYKDIVKMASALKKKGSEYSNFVKNKTSKAISKIKTFKKKKGKKGKTQKGKR